MLRFSGGVDYANGAQHMVSASAEQLQKAALHLCIGGLRYRSLDHPGAECRCFAGWRGHRELERRLEVGLLEARIHAPRVGGLELGVEVDLVVDRVDESMKAFAGAHECTARSHDEDVLRLEVIEADARSLEDVGRDEFATVEIDGQHLGRNEVDPCRCTRLARAERDGCRRREVAFAGGEVQVDVVAVDGDQLAALGSLCAGHILAHGVILADPFGSSGGTVTA